MAKSDGGPAFPFTPNPQPRNSDGPWTQDWDCGESGMTLRDWFAGQALAGLSSRGDLSSGEIADLAYDTADAMMEVRANREKGKPCQD